MALVPDEAVERMAEVSGAAFKVYAYYCRRRNHATGDCWPSLKTTARDTGLCYSYVSEIRKELVRVGWIRLENDRILLLCGFVVSENPKMNISENPKISSENPKPVSENPKRYIKELTSPINQQAHTIEMEAAQIDKPKRGTRIPDPFLLTSEMRRWADTSYPKVDVKTQTELFVNYWRSKAGKDACKLDWLATWRNWIIRANDYNQQGNIDNAKNQNYRPSTADKLNGYAAVLRKYGTDNAG